MMSRRWMTACLALAASDVGCITATGGGSPPPDAAVTDTPRADVAMDTATPPPDVTPPVDAAVTDLTQPRDVVSDTAVTDVAPVDAGCGSTWPSCDAMPMGATPSTIAQIWAADPMRPTFHWVSGAVVTAISRGGCAAGSACQVFVQEPTTSSALMDVAHHAIKVFVSAASSSRFASIRVGDRVDIAAHAWRYNISGQNELLLQVADSCSLRGCMLRTGSGSVAPAPATLDALGSVMAYEYRYGPVLVRFENVSATTDASSALDSTTGGLFVTGVPLDAGSSEPISVSPFFMMGSRFVGYTNNQRLRFSSLTGVFGMFIPSVPAPDGGLAKYLQVYPRSPADLVLAM